MEQGAIPGYETATPEEQHEYMQELFRKVFMSDEGKIVFNILLDDLNFFKPARDEAEKGPQRVCEIPHCGPHGL